MVHRSRHWSKRQRGVGGVMWQPASKLQLCQKGESSMMGVHVVSYWRGRELTREGVGREMMAIVLPSHSVLICLQHELTFYI